MTNLNSRKFRFTITIVKTLPPHHPDSKSTSSEYSDTEVIGLRLMISKAVLPIIGRSSLGMTTRVLQTPFLFLTGNAIIRPILYTLISKGAYKKGESVIVKLL
ncbi:hypothetical protein [Vibrio algarum]|uniref:Uncharacterized protein n=1 Tax=Vibrio algarum TaxID=3020714 RepID=A0ABT4YRQ7_9VIBR|nr:hypothetical protein [Vibrio sp. KJ40-1]MDB1124242.1 hypothetical protein [Vibrio sp. KJ40-1]